MLIISTKLKQHDLIESDMIYLLSRKANSRDAKQQVSQNKTNIHGNILFSFHQKACMHVFFQFSE